MRKTTSIFKFIFSHKTEINIFGIIISLHNYEEIINIL